MNEAVKRMHILLGQGHLLKVDFLFRMIEKSTGNVLFCVSWDSWHENRFHTEKQKL